MDSETKRLYLRVTAKLMVLAMLLALAITFLRSIPATDTADGTSLAVELGTLSPGQVVRLQWGAKRVILLKRPAMDEARRRTLDASLADPGSRHSRQPDFAENPYRSRDPRYFVALDYGTDLNCQLDYLDRKADGPAGRPWLGGFRDRCRGSWYDDAGRVYKAQRALRNLEVPVYRIEGTTLLLGER